MIILILMEDTNNIKTNRANQAEELEKLKAIKQLTDPAEWEIDNNSTSALIRTLNEKN